jgi:hypothetical protein
VIVRGLPLLGLAALAACSGDGGARLATASLTLADTVALDDGSSCAFSAALDGVEDDSTPWLCPSCLTTYVAPLSFITGADCLSPLFPGGAPPSLLFGWSSDGHFLYGFGDSAAAPSASATVQSRLGNAAGDRLHGQVPPPSYDCGWPSAARPPFSGSYQPQLGDPLPDAVLDDQCGQPLRLFDLAGNYLVLHMNQSDMPDYAPCAPCQVAAAGQAQFEADMTALGIPTFVVSLLVPTNDDSELSPPQDRLQRWMMQEKVSGPVLADRGFGPTVVGPVAAGGDATAVSYPSLVLVGRDGTILWGSVGYDPMMWSDLETRIVADAAQ